MRGRRSRRAGSSAFTSRPGAGSIQAWWWSWSTRRRPHRCHGPRNALVLRLPLGALIALVSAALVPGNVAPPGWGTAAAAVPPLVALDDDKEKEEKEKEKEEKPKDDSNPPGGQGPPASPPGQSSPPPGTTPSAPPPAPKAPPAPAPPPASKAKAEPKASSKPSDKASTKAEPKKPKAAAAKITATPSQVATPSAGTPSQPAPTSAGVSGAIGGSSVGGGGSGGGAQSTQTPAVSSGGARSVQTPDVSSGGASPEGQSSGAGSAGTAQPPVTTPVRPVPRGFRATPVRFLTSSDTRRASGTTLTFVLRKAGRVRFTVLGRAPDCRPLGKFSRAARRGPNRIRFLGRLRGKPLPAGRYTIVAEVMRARRWKPLARVTVVVLAPNRKLSRARASAPARAECRRALVTAVSVGQSGAATLPPSSLAAATVRSSAGAAGQLQPASGGVAGASATERSASREGDSDPISDLPVLSAIIPENSSVPPLVLGLVALVAVALGALFLMALVLKFVRQTWQP
jgi:hypothetical protein